MLVSIKNNYNLSQIFSEAWAIVKDETIAFCEALRKAWQKAKEALKQLNFDADLLAELTIDQLNSLRTVIDNLITQKELLPEGKEVELCDDIQLKVKDGKVYTTSYYNSDFVGKARGLQGKWDSGQWVFPEAILEHVKNAMLDCYGVTGENPYPVCVLEIKNFSKDGHQSGVELFGRPVAKASGRDSGAKLQDHIIKISGRVNSGGSVKNWRTVVENANFEIHKFAIARAQRADVQKAIEEGWCVIK